MILPKPKFWATGCCLLLACFPLFVETAVTQELTDQDFRCLLEAPSKTEVGAPVSGVLASIYVDRGDLVEEGDLLFELQSDVERARYEAAEARAGNRFAVQAAEAQLDLANTNAQRLLDLQERNQAAVNASEIAQALAEREIANSNLGNAVFDLELAQLEAQAALATLAERSVHSPVEGVVLERSMSAGEYRHDQAIVLTLVTLHPLNVEAFLPSLYFGEVEVGQVAQVVVAEPLNQQLEAMVSAIDPVIDSGSGTFGVRLTLPNPNYEIPAGLSCFFSLEPL